MQSADELRSEYNRSDFGEIVLGKYAQKIKEKASAVMKIHELVIEMKLLERRLTLYEEKYGVLSEDFHAALMAGRLAEYDAHDETREDFSRWKGIFEIWWRRKVACLLLNKICI